eukprot:CAMPEP_0114588170 /NCGR_PEP_ID=MMETSP0125-20121206/10940_1 /TAXON_ID=485358 ORGANISM="Aristerostoma sp., Strain ATCC 50986" /NCGR_SAMPLE_ID=MMETSP0125 /ASSEMBLY_ACC=CAM_ASM_000245 /LENGTH=38 /DNA_ID= /DNA_START= /DNA_END= /DNA_ORIENTATION=
MAQYKKKIQGTHKETKQRSHQDAKLPDDMVYEIKDIFR